MLKEDEGKETAEEIAAKVNGTIVGFVEFNAYQIELKTSSIKELEDALRVVQS